MTDKLIKALKVKIRKNPQAQYYSLTYAKKWKIINTNDKRNYSKFVNEPLKNKLEEKITTLSDTSPDQVFELSRSSYSSLDSYIVDGRIGFPARYNLVQKLNSSAWGSDVTADKIISFSQLEGKKKYLMSVLNFFMICCVLLIWFCK